MGYGELNNCGIKKGGVGVEGSIAASAVIGCVMERRWLAVVVLPVLLVGVEQERIGDGDELGSDDVNEEEEEVEGKQKETGFNAAAPSSSTSTEPVIGFNMKVFAPLSGMSNKYCSTLHSATS